MLRAMAAAVARKEGGIDPPPVFGRAACPAMNAQPAEVASGLRVVAHPRRKARPAVDPPFKLRISRRGGPDGGGPVAVDQIDQLVVQPEVEIFARLRLAAAGEDYCLLLDEREQAAVGCLESRDWRQVAAAGSGS